jgi:hypothetical protein
MPRLRLPPLPPARDWRTAFPRTSIAGFKVSAHESQMSKGETSGRMSLANPSLCDAFVRALGIRKDEVVVETYCGGGQLTRSLLAGGNNETTAADWAEVDAEAGTAGDKGNSKAQAQVEAEADTGNKTKRTKTSSFKFPEWNVASAPKYKGKLSPEVAESLVQPKLVVANDPHFATLARGLGFNPNLVPHSKYELAKTDKASKSEPHLRRAPSAAHPSNLQDALVFSTQSVYHWPSLPDILSDPLVVAALPVYDNTKTGVEATYRPWSAPPPPITIVTNFPTAVVGDQMISQWISSAAGSEDYGRSWLWKWGRVRIAGLVHRGMYDVSLGPVPCYTRCALLTRSQRLMAQPGETIHCKLSVLTHALFDVRPLPPYHHVPDVDKQSSRFNTVPLNDGSQKSGSQKSYKIKPTHPAPPPIDEVTLTRTLDFYKWNGPAISQDRADENERLPRPLLLGIELLPRLNTPLKAEQRDVWDYVLRKCFVRETSSIGEAIPKLAFGADNLLPRFMDEGSRYAGNPVLPTETVRNLKVDQWARIVDVFDKWAFKPDSLLVEAPAVEESREIGMSV